MTVTLNARIPFPEQEDGLDVVFPRSENASLYRQLEKVKDGETCTVQHPSGVRVVVAPIEGEGDAHERINAALALMSTIRIVRRGAQLLLANFELNATNRPMFGIETMGDVVAAIERDGPAVSTEEPPSRPSSGDTMVNSGETRPIPTPGKAPPRKLSQADFEKLHGEKPKDAGEGADQAWKRWFNRRK